LTLIHQTLMKPIHILMSIFDDLWANGYGYILIG